jgi:hypothetical protein
MFCPSPLSKLAIKGERSKTLISLLPPGSPKKACQNQRDWSAIASRMTLRFLSLSWNCPCQATGQFFQVQCMQSRLANMPGNPRLVLICTCCSKSALVGCRKYWASKQPRIATTPYSNNPTLHGLQSSGFSQPTVFITSICRDSVC